MFRNTLTFKFGKTIGLFYLLCIAAGTITILAEKLYYAIKHITPPDYGLFFAVVLLMNAAVILIANFFFIQIILFLIDCVRLKKIIKMPAVNTPMPKQIYEYFLFALSVIIPIGYIAAILPNIK